MSSPVRKAPPIPEITGVDSATAKILRPMREWINVITGRQGTTPIQTLDGTPALNDVHNKLNELIKRLNQ